MRLYKSNSGQWFGTQADARRNSPRQWVEVDVPTSKQDLLNWLNDNKVGGISQQVQSKPQAPSEPKPELLSKDAAGWVSWAYERLRRGKKADAEEMLLKGLKIQRALTSVEGA